MCNRASDYAENVSPGPAENDDIETGCSVDGNPTEPGHSKCRLCEADDKWAADFARQLVDDFLFLPARMSREGR